MESLKRRIAVPHSSPRITSPRTTRQHPANDSIQIFTSAKATAGQQRCQQQQSPQ